MLRVECRPAFVYETSQSILLIAHMWAFRYKTATGTSSQRFQSEKKDEVVGFKITITFSGFSLNLLAYFLAISLGEKFLSLYAYDLYRSGMTTPLVFYQ